MPGNLAISLSALLIYNDSADGITTHAMTTYTEESAGAAGLVAVVRRCLRTLFVTLGYSLSMVLTLWIAITLLQAGASPLKVLAVSTLATLGVVIGGEMLHPLTKSWRPTFRDNFYPDIVIFITNNVLLVSPLVQALLATFAVSLAGGGLGVWPGHWPLWLQLPLALLVAEFGNYWFHRATHEVPFLWRFHRLHHSPSRLYWLNATRFHYLDVTLLSTTGLVPLLVLGVGPEVVVLHTVFSMFHGYWQHANTHQRLGLLNYLMSGPELHRWHHNLDRRDANSNYGSNLIVWDLVFGTFRWPAEEPRLYNIGIDDPNYPRTPLAQMLDPLRQRRAGETAD